MEKTKVKIGSPVEPLKPRDCLVESVNIVAVSDKNEVPVGDKVVLTCKHPDKVETIDISKVKYLKRGTKVATSGIWFTLGNDGLIPANSALASMLKYYEAEVVDEMVGQKIQTSTDEEGYLVVKAF